MQSLVSFLLGIAIAGWGVYAMKETLEYRREGRLADGLRDWRGPLVFGTYLVVVLLILERFWSYWSSLL